MTVVVELLLINLAANIFWQTVIAPRIFTRKPDPNQDEDIPGLDGDAVMLDSLKPPASERKKPAAPGGTTGIFNMSTRKRDRLFGYIRKNVSKGFKSQGCITILPRLPPELLYEVLEKCDFQTLWNFARASLASYLLCFRILARKFTFPLSLPQAITSGLLAHHKASGAYDSIKYITLDVSDETWWGPKPPRRAQQGPPKIPPTYLDEIKTFLEFVKSNNKQCDIKLYSPKDGSHCSITGFSTLYQLIFSTAPRNIDSLIIRISINPYNDSYFEKELDLIQSKIREQIYPDPTWTWNGSLNVGLPMRSLTLEITTEQQIRTISHLPSMLAKTIMASEHAPSNLEKLKVIMLNCNQSKQNYFSPFRQNFIFDYLSTPNLKKLHVLDRRQTVLERYSEHLALGCPELEELYIDCGLDSEPSDYTRLWRLHKLRILTLPFPGNTYPMLDILNIETAKRRFAFQMGIAGSIIRYHGGVIEEINFVATESEDQETDAVLIPRQRIH
ncbi:hypothetical protein H072_4735 [Dactylellina haptotyla CBS 200.50]|uniref:F-box domain-containing protein n=1 Tax=Dactylellina haptotyla (strain CBS 200.50) TaxID=1284197 RepID=S8AEP4_DACHA|nr:hypothetical protein H072_4735 [Dactylellina haptotyla CBS 200.50]